MFGFGGTVKVAIVAAVVIATMAGGFYLYYKDSQARIAVLIENSAKLEQAVQTQNLAIAQLENDAKKFAELNKELTLQMQKAEEYKDTLINKLRKHDLTKLSEQKPALIEKRINDATAKLFDEFEKITAHPNTVSP
jgi:Tfp pilus assembly protein PilO